MAVAATRRFPVTLAIPRRLPITTAMLSLGLAVMFGWERGLIVSSAGTRVGRLVLAGAVLSLLVEMRGVTRIWALRRALIRPPGVLALGAGWLLAGLVWVSSSTNGCRCSGGAQGLLEIEVWIAVTTIVALGDPASRPVLLAAAGVGCLLAAVLAFIGVQGTSTMASASTRLAGTYGNANYFAATQAFGLPIAVAGTLQLRAPVLRVASAGAGVAMAVALLLSYSRSGIVAAALGIAVTILMVVPHGRRLFTAAGLLAGAGLAAWLLYPAFSRERDKADLGTTILAFTQTDGSGWSRYPTSAFKHPAAAMRNPRPDVLQIVASRRSAGVSVDLGSVSTGRYGLRFDVRATTKSQIVRYGLEDNGLGISPAFGLAVTSSAWKPIAVTWSPSRTAPNARAYFWAGTPGSFELRHVRLLRQGLPARTLSVRLVGRATSVQRQIDQIERRYLRSREGAARIALDAFAAHPAFGIGWERFPFYAAPRSGVGPIAAHDEYLRFAAELGLPGALLLLLCCLSVAWAAYDARRSRVGAALAGLLVAGAVALAFGNELESPGVFLPVAAGMSLAVAMSAEARRQDAGADHG